MGRVTSGVTGGCGRKVFRNGWPHSYSKDPRIAAGEIWAENGKRQWALIAYSNYAFDTEFSRWLSSAR